MAAYRYRALAAGGEVRSGIMEAASEADVVARLRREGSLPMRAEPLARDSLLARLLHSEFRSEHRLRTQEVAEIMRELATMVGAGQDLDRALRYVQETATSDRVRRVITSVRDTVRDGSPLAVALAREPRSFSRLHVAMVRAGEAGAQLPETLARMADLLDRQRALAASVTSALIYPCLLVLAAIGAVTLLLTQVLPQFVPLFEQSGAALPASTQFLVDAGNFLANDGAFLLLGLLIAVLTTRAILRQPRPRLFADRLVLRLPVIGGLMREIVAARLTRALGTLLTNGIALIPALAIVRDAVGNRAAVAAVDRATVSARGGGGLAQTLAEANVLPTRAVHLLRLGEENAQLGTMAMRAAEIHEDRARIILQRLVALLVPAITIIMGMAVAGIVASLLTAMLSLNDLANA